MVFLSSHGFRGIAQSRPRRPRDRLNADLIDFAKA
jgi:hypothetical protein